MASVGVHHLIGHETVEDLPEKHLLYILVSGMGWSTIGFALTMVIVARISLAIPALEQLRATPGMLQLFRAIMHSVSCSVLLTLVATAAVIFDTDSHPRFMFAYAVLIVGTLSVWKFGKAVYLLWRIIRLEMTSYQRLHRRRARRRPNASAPRTARGRYRS